MQVPVGCSAGFFQKKKGAAGAAPLDCAAGGALARLPRFDRLRLDVRSEGAANVLARIADAERAAGQAPRADDAQRAVLVLAHEHAVDPRVARVIVVHGDIHVLGVSSQPSRGELAWRHFRVTVTQAKARCSGHGVTIAVRGRQAFGV